MKNLLILFNLIISITLYSQSYSGIATYKKNISQRDNELLNSDNTEVNEFMKSILEDSYREADNLEFELLFNTSESLFRAKPSLSINGGMGYKLALSLEGGNGELYTNIKSKTQLWKREAYGETFIVSSNLDSIQWQVTKKQKKIGSYTCYKAVGHKLKKTNSEIFDVRYEAWFTSDVPVSFGPGRYCNLPGLIIEVSIYLPTQLVVFSLKKLELRNKKIEIKKPDEGIELTQKEFENKGRMMYEKFKKMR